MLPYFLSVNIIVNHDGAWHFASASLCSPLKINRKRTLLNPGYVCHRQSQTPETASAELCVECADAFASPGLRNISGVNSPVSLEDTTARSYCTYCFGCHEALAVALMGLVQLQKKTRQEGTEAGRRHRCSLIW